MAPITQHGRLSQTSNLFTKELRLRLNVVVRRHVVFARQQ
jgi:hypothetical protein